MCIPIIYLVGCNFDDVTSMTYQNIIKNLHKAKRIRPCVEAALCAWTSLRIIRELWITCLSPPSVEPLEVSTLTYQQRIDERRLRLC